MEYVDSAREEYLQEDGDEDKWLFNLEWKVVPLITSQKEEYPSILTCNEHNDGAEFLCIHSYQ